jgi:hypothetical protein
MYGRGTSACTIVPLTLALLLMLPLAASAQRGITLDQAVSAALSNSCAALQGAQGANGGKYGPGISGPSFISPSARRRRPAPFRARQQARSRRRPGQMNSKKNAACASG